MHPGPNQVKLALLQYQDWWAGAVGRCAANGDRCTGDAGVGLAGAAVGVVVDCFGGLDERVASCQVAHGTSAALGGAACHPGSAALGLAITATLALEGFPSSALGQAGASECSAQQ